MANAKKLTEPQIAALRAAARGDMWGATRADSLRACQRRGLVNLRPDRTLSITPAGRQALFEATGEHGGFGLMQIDDVNRGSYTAFEKRVAAGIVEGKIKPNRKPEHISKVIDRVVSNLKPKKED